ncbi:MAG TPA: cytochrome c [Longimicrobium sp.]
MPIARLLPRAALAALLLLAACGPRERRPPDPPRRATAGGLPRQGPTAHVPLGEMAGVGVSRLGYEIPNPYAGNPVAIQDGQRLFGAMNCVGCHDYDGSGGMGPNLRDRYWRYGGTPAEVYKTIFEGRPKGMPAWGSALPPDEIWRVVAWIQTLGGSWPASPTAVGLSDGTPDPTSAGGGGK